MNPAKVTFEEMIDICKVYVDNYERLPIPTKIKCDITFEPDNGKLMVFNFKPDRSLYENVSITILSNACRLDFKYHFEMVARYSKNESTGIDIPIDINDSYRNITGKLSPTVYEIIEQWWDIIAEIRLWYEEFNLDPNLPKQIYDLIKGMTPTMIRSLVARGTITEELAQKLLLMRDRVLNGWDYPNIKHCIE